MWSAQIPAQDTIRRELQLAWNLFIELPCIAEMTKIAIAGKIISVQPRIRLLRSFDQRQHNYSGYALLVAAVADPDKPAARVGVGPAAQAKFSLRAGGTPAAEV